jgi:hypothetical protein
LEFNLDIKLELNLDIKPEPFQTAHIQAAEPFQTAHSPSEVS